MSARACGPPPSREAPPGASAETPSAPSECPMCGLTFTAGLAVCGGCPLHGGCDLVRCPRCLYSFPRRSRLVDFLRRLGSARARFARWPFRRRPAHARSEEAR